jgi:hypothetical protein
MVVDDREEQGIRIRLQSSAIPLPASRPVSRVFGSMRLRLTSDTFASIGNSFRKSPHMQNRRTTRGRVRAVATAISGSGIQSRHGAVI